MKLLASFLDKSVIPDLIWDLFRFLIKMIKETKSECRSKQDFLLNYLGLIGLDPRSKPGMTKRLKSVFSLLGVLTTVSISSTELNQREIRNCCELKNIVYNAWEDSPEELCELVAEYMNSPIERTFSMFLTKEFPNYCHFSWPHEEVETGFSVRWEVPFTISLRYKGGVAAILMPGILTSFSRSENRELDCYSRLLSVSELRQVFEVLKSVTNYYTTVVGRMEHEFIELNKALWSLAGCNYLGWKAKGGKRGISIENKQLSIQLNFTHLEKTCLKGLCDSESLFAASVVYMTTGRKTKVVIIPENVLCSIDGLIERCSSDETKKIWCESRKNKDFFPRNLDVLEYIATK
ncbi:hypothetical protein ACFLY6_00055 [Candidatus Dependentiae bacterium]